MSSNRRDLIRMTDDEMAAFIEEQKSLQVACHDRDGSIHLSTLWFSSATTGSPCCWRTG